MNATPVMMPAPILLLDGARLSRLLRAGIQRLLADQEHLNRINVFAVPDGDTAHDECRAHEPEAYAGWPRGHDADPRRRCRPDGARGNSGAILAQFLLGMGDSASNHAELSTEEFAAAVTTGATYARDSLSEPREGTVLTVITDFASESARLAALGIRDFFGLFSQALPRARASLAGTSSQLDELRAAGVVDAGARGFVDLLEGMIEHLERGVDAEPAETVTVEADTHEAAGEAHDLTHRFCTECTITGTNIDRRKLREELSSLGWQEHIEASFVMPVGSALSVHGGPGTLVVGIQEA